MNELQAKIKAIQTELESICADVSKPESRMTTLVDSPDRHFSDLETPIEPFPVNAFTNAAQIQRRGATISRVKAAVQTEPESQIRSEAASQTRSKLRPQADFNPEFRPPSSHVSLPHSPSRSQSPVFDRPVPSPTASQTRLQHPVLTRSADTVKPAQPLIRPALQELKAQAEQINQISQTQENALRRLQSIAAQIEQERRNSQTTAKPSSAETDRPTVNLSLPLEQFPVQPRLDNAQRQRELQDQAVSSAQTMTLQFDPAIQASTAAYETAQMLRQRQERGGAAYQEQLLPRRRSRRQASLLKRLRRWLFPRPSRRSENTEAVPFTLRETLTLLVGAALTRLLINLLLEAVPLMIVPTMILLIVPAAIAVYRTTTEPQSGIIWGYRLCIIVLGLLIGGRL